MHRVEYSSAKPVGREVTVHCTDRQGVSQQKQVALVNLAALILNSVQPRAASRNVAQVQRIEWGEENV
jgi:hypothetical protein